MLSLVVEIFQGFFVKTLCKILHLFWYFAISNHASFTFFGRISELRFKNDLESKVLRIAWQIFFLFFIFSFFYLFFFMIHFINWVQKFYIYSEYINLPEKSVQFFKDFQKKFKDFFRIIKNFLAKIDFWIYFYNCLDF